MSRRRGRTGNILMAVGIACIITSIGIIAVPMYGVWTREHADSSALDAWNRGGSAALVGPLPRPSAAPGGTPTAAPACGSGSSRDYALVTFPSLAKYSYAGVAGDGTWDQLLERSMVHYATSPAPGEQGNVIIAFHREPDYEHIDELKAGDIVTVQNRTCVTFSYRISQRWELDPAAVTQLDSTNGHELTLITCTPWFQDQRRYVWRAELTS